MQSQAVLKSTEKSLVAKTSLTSLMERLPASALVASSMTATHDILDRCMSRSALMTVSLLATDTTGALPTLVTVRLSSGSSMPLSLATAKAQMADGESVAETRPPSAGSVTKSRRALTRANIAQAASSVASGSMTCSASRP